MADRWLINASPVILLAKAEVIRFLPQLCDELVIPTGVVGEVRNVHITDAGRFWLHGDGQRFVRAAPPIHPALAGWRGGAGEVEVISWALQNRGFTAVLDDRRARTLATRHGLDHNCRCTRRPRRRTKGRTLDSSCRRSPGEHLGPNG